MTFAPGLYIPGEDRSPQVVCDTCGATLNASARGHRGPPRWLIDGRVPPGWRKTTETPARHSCPVCVKAVGIRGGAR
jgi:hypothetical protein